MTASDVAKRPSRALVFIALAMGIDMAGVGLIVPVMPDLIAELADVSIGAAAGLGGWLVVAYAGLQFFFAPVAGGLGDRFGRRPVLLAALAGLAVDYLIMALAPSLWVLFVGRVLAGVCGSTWAVANAYAADISDEETRARNFAIVQAAGAAGLVLGPAVGGLLGAVDLRAPFFAAAALAFANFLYGMFVLPETLAREDRRSFDWRRANPLGGLAKACGYPLVGGILAAFFLMQLATQALVHIWAFYTKEVFSWSTLEIGLSVTFYGLMLAAVQGGLTGPVVRRIGERRAALFGFSVGVAAYLIFAFAGAPWHLYAGIIIGSAGGFVTPSLQAIITRAAPRDAQGELQGAITSVVAVTVVLGPLVMTQLFAAFTRPTGLYFPGAPFLASAALIVASATLFQVVVGGRAERAAEA